MLVAHNIIHEFIFLYIYKKVIYLLIPSAIHYSQYNIIILLFEFLKFLHTCLTYEKMSLFHLQGN